MAGVPQFKDTPYGRRGIRFIDLTNQRFGRLLVLSFASINKNKRADWLCKCDCGTEKILEGKLIRKGVIQSCGCLWVESISLPPGEASFNNYYLGYKVGAEKRNLCFEITKEEFKTLTSQNCYYCNDEPREIGRENANGKYFGNGVDRVENSLGYVKSNCVACCKNCNIAKACLSQKDFLDLVCRIYENRIGR